MSWRRKVRPEPKIWAMVRLKALDRDSWACVTCGRKGRLEVDHKTPLEDGGEMYMLTNLQCLCRGCHIVKTKLENQRRQVKPEVQAWLDFMCGHGV